MMRLFTPIVFLLFTFINQNDDTTLLENRRQKIIKLFADLRKAPRIDSEDYPKKEEFEIYRPLERMYFKPPKASSEFSILEDLYQIQGLAFHYDDSTVNFQLRYPNPRIDSITDVSKLHGYLKNVLILYASMYDNEWEMCYFAFKPESDQLIWMISAGGESDVYRRKKHFLNELYLPINKR